MAGSFCVLVVCHANHCRSPLAEHLLRVAASERNLDWQVSSTGTHARPGIPMHASVARILAGRGLNTTEWRSQAITPELVRHADLILTASEAQQSVVRFDSSALRRTYTIRQFAHLAAVVTEEPTVELADYGHWLMREVWQRRGQTQPLPQGQRDIGDPMGQSFQHFRRCAAVIDRALDQIFSSVPPSSTASSTHWW